MSEQPVSQVVSSDLAADYPGAEFDRHTAALLQPRNYVNPTQDGRYHLVIIGAGPAGLVSAIGAAGLGANVALIERHTMGGDCLNVGCVPSKALLEYTEHHPNADFASAFSWLREVRAGIAHHDSVERYTELGVDVYLGDASFNAQGQVEVDGVALDARRVAICTGARAAVPPIPGLIEAEPLTNETVFDLTEQPKSIAILGAGAIGCELAMVFARLGTEVHLFELADRIMPLEIEEASAAVTEALQALGVNVHTGKGVASVERDGNIHHVKTDDFECQTEAVLVALGRRPNTESLKLENAGIEMDQRGFIVTDSKLRTSNKEVYAAGDCTARLQFTHHADAQARAIIQNSLIAPTAKVDGLIVPHCTYTKPEVAGVGPSPEELDKQGVAYDQYEFSFTDLDRGRAEINGAGFARVYTKKGSDKILSATIVGHDAGEQLAPIVLMMSNRLGLGSADKALFSYPTRSEYLKRLALAYNKTRFTPTVAKIFQTWLNFIR